MAATPHDPQVGVPPGVPQNMIAPTGNVPAIGIGTTQDYPRLVFSAPYFETVAIADIIEPSVMEAVENVLPSLIPPYVDAAVLAGVQQYSVLLTGSTMSGPLFLSPLMPTAPSQAATMAYVDAMIATAGIPEVPPVPVGQVWGRETGQWVPIDESGGDFLPIAGGSMQGIINMSGNTITNMAAVPAMPNGAAPAQWVLNQIASVSLYQGTWDADTNTPDLTQLSVRVNGYTWIAITTSVSGVVVGAAIPGLQGTTVYNGDTIIYSTVQGVFTAIHAGGLSLPEADARYVQLAGSQMSGALLLNADAVQPLQAVTFEQLEAAVANMVTPDAPADGQGYLRVGVGGGSWVPGLPLAGGILTGTLTLAGPGATGNQAVTVAQMNSAISAVGSGFMPIAGGTFTGPVVLSGNATVSLNPVSLGQLTSMLATYAPIQNAALTGVPTVPLAAPGTSTGQIASTAFVMGAMGSFLPIAGGTITGNLNVNGTLTPGIIDTIGGASGFYLANQGGTLPTLNFASGQYLQWTGTGLTITTSVGLAITSSATSFSSAISGPSANFTGSCNAGNSTIGGIVLTGGTLSGASAAFSGSCNAGNSTIGGITLNGGSLSGTGNIGTTSGTISAVGANFTGSCNAGNGTIGGVAMASNNITIPGSAGVTGTVTAQGASIAGSCNAGNGTFGGVIFNGAQNLWPTTDNASSCGAPGNAWAQVASYAFPQSSGEALKTGITRIAPDADIPDVADEIMALNPATYRWRSGPDTEHLHWGFIAGDVANVFGEDFGGYHKDDEGNEAITYNDLVSVLWRGVQQLTNRVAALEAGK